MTLRPSAEDRDEGLSASGPSSNANRLSTPCDPQRGRPVSVASSAASGAAGHGTTPGGGPRSNTTPQHPHTRTPANWSLQGSQIEGSLSDSRSGTVLEETPTKAPRDILGTTPTRTRGDFPNAEYGAPASSGVSSATGMFPDAGGDRRTDLDLGNSKRFTNSYCEFLTSLDSENEEDQPGSPFAALNRQTNAGTFAKRSGPYARSSFISGDRSSLAGDLQSLASGAGGRAAGGPLFNLGVAEDSVPQPPQNLYRSRRYLVLSAMMQLCVVGWLVIASIPRLGGGWLSLVTTLFTALAARRSALVVEQYCYNHRDNLVATSYVDLAEAAGGRILRVAATALIFFFWFGLALVLYSFCALLLYTSTPMLVYGSSLGFHQKYLNYVAQHNGMPHPQSNLGDERNFALETSTVVPPIFDIRWYYGGVGAGLLLLSILGSIFTRRGVVRLWNMYLLNILTVITALIAIVLNITVATTRKKIHREWTTLLPEGVSGAEFLVSGFAKSVTLVAWSALFVILVPRLGTTHPFFARVNDTLPPEFEVGGGTRGTFRRVLTRFGSVVLVVVLAILVTCCLVFSEAPQVIVLFENFHRRQNVTGSQSSASPDPAIGHLHTGHSQPATPVPVNDGRVLGEDQGDKNVLRLVAACNLLLLAFLLVLCHRCCTELCIMVWNPPVKLNRTLHPNGGSSNGETAAVQYAATQSSQPYTTTSPSSQLERARLNSSDLNSGRSRSELFTPTPHFKQPQSKLESCWMAVTRKFRRSQFCKCCFPANPNPSSCCCCFTICCRRCCFSDLETQESQNIQRRSGASRFSVTGFLKTMFRCVLLPLAWFVMAGTGSYFFICGTSATCGTDIEGGRFDAAPMSRWLLALMAAVSGLLIVPLAFVIPCIVELVLGRLMQQATLGRKRGEARPDFAVATASSTAGAVSGIGTLTSGDAMGPAIGGSFNHDQWFLGGDNSDGQKPGDGEEGSAATTCWSWISNQGATWLYRTYCLFLCLFGIVAAVQVGAELLTGNIVQFPN